MDEFTFCFGVIMFAPPVIMVTGYIIGRIIGRIWKHFFPPKNTLKWEDE